MVDISKMPLLPGAHYGKIDETPEDENAELPEVEGMDEDDDELQHPTDPALIDMLGFDPADPAEWEDEEDNETVRNADGSMSKKSK